MGTERDTAALDEIHAAMDRREWNGDLWSVVAEIIAGTGRAPFGGPDDD